MANVFAKDSEVYDAISGLQAEVERLKQKTGLAEEDRKAAEAEQKAAEEAEAKRTDEEQPQQEMPKTAAASSPEAPKPDEKPVSKSGSGSR